MPSLTNFVLSNTALSASGTAIFTNEIEADYGDIVACEVRIQSLTGAPATASLALAFQCAPVEYNGYNMNWEPSGDLIHWQSVVAADGYLSPSLLDGAWPALDQTLTYPLDVVRRIVVTPLSRLVRLSMTPTFSGGASPAFTVSVAMSVSGK